MSIPSCLEGYLFVYSSSFDRSRLVFTHFGSSGCNVIFFLSVWKLLEDIEQTRAVRDVGVGIEKSGSREWRRSMKGCVEICFYLACCKMVYIII